MNSRNTLIGLAVLYGLMKALQKVFSGAEIGEIAFQFLGSTVIGTLITMGIAWVVLKILGKLHLHLIVTNWIMLFGVCFAILAGFLSTS